MAQYHVLVGQKTYGAEEVLCNDLFEGQVLLITGGGTGIGRDVALAAVKLGASAIAICGRREGPLISTGEEIKKLGASVYYESCDIRDYEAVSCFVRNTIKNLGKIDILINNAGGQFLISAEYLTSKGFSAVIRNNLIGTWNMTHAVATQAFIPKKNGSVVMVTAQIRNGFPGMVHTGAARAGVENMVKTLCIEWAHHGIRVNAIAPGMIISSGTERYPPQFLSVAADNTPLRRAGSSKEIALQILFLASDKASGFTTGQTFYVDGGHSLSGQKFDVENFGSPKL
eukprot:TRINITY_DN3431_c0_g1_i3.p1 TRINITY_DN3431_c0_g1~~TRINITY_DN3431_c0_g1_i3.p1  ORF type:complete len:285 (+),score=59.08 TRINITY_DN3431_c0_g1_i3:182-1036(+)